jgi:RHS repeat-associated protein
MDIKRALGQRKLWLLTLVLSSAAWGLFQGWQRHTSKPAGESIETAVLATPTTSTPIAKVTSPAGSNFTVTLVQDGISPGGLCVIKTAANGASIFVPPLTEESCRVKVAWSIVPSEYDANMFIRRQYGFMSQDKRYPAGMPSTGEYVESLVPLSVENDLSWQYSYQLRQPTTPGNPAIASLNLSVSEAKNDDELTQGNFPTVNCNNELGGMGVGVPPIGFLPGRWRSLVPNANPALLSQMWDPGVSYDIETRPERKNSAGIVTRSRQLRATMYTFDNAHAPVWLQTQWMTFTPNGLYSFRGELRRYRWNSALHLRGAGRKVGYIKGTVLSMDTAPGGRPNVARIGVDWGWQEPGVTNSASAGIVTYSGCLFANGQTRIDPLATNLLATPSSAKALGGLTTQADAISTGVNAADADVYSIHPSTELSDQDSITLIDGAESHYLRLWRLPPSGAAPGRDQSVWSEPLWLTAQLNSPANPLALETLNVKYQRSPYIRGITYSPFAPSCVGGSANCEVPCLANVGTLRRTWLANAPERLEMNYNLGSNLSSGFVGCPVNASSPTTLPNFAWVRPRPTDDTNTDVIPDPINGDRSLFFRQSWRSDDRRANLAAYPQHCNKATRNSLCRFTLDYTNPIALSADKYPLKLVRVAGASIQFLGQTLIEWPIASIASSSVFPSRGRFLDESFSATQPSFNQGTYLYQLRDKNGVVLGESNSTFVKDPVRPLPPGCFRIVGGNQQNDTSLECTATANSSINRVAPGGAMTAVMQLPNGGEYYNFHINEKVVINGVESSTARCTDLPAPTGDNSRPIVILPDLNNTQQQLRSVFRACNTPGVYRYRISTNTLQSLGQPDLQSDAVPAEGITIIVGSDLVVPTPINLTASADSAVASGLGYKVNWQSGAWLAGNTPVGLIYKIQRAKLPDTTVTGPAIPPTGAIEQITASADVTTINGVVPVPGKYFFWVRACAVTEPSNCSGWSLPSSGLVLPVVSVQLSSIAPALAPDPLTDNDSDTIEALDGKLDVGADGAATYDIPIELPRGRGGVQPSIGIVYRSTGGDGTLGEGFSLRGLSSISRCRKSKEQGDGDGPHPAISFNLTSDQFCLDGQRLLLIEGTHGSDGAKYRTEIDSYSEIQIVSQFNQNGLTGPEQFKLFRRDGSVATFGGYSASKISTQAGRTAAISWAIASELDVNGNAINYIYKQDVAQGVLEISSVGYVGGKVEFVYETKLTPRKTFTGGLSWATLDRINAITVSSEGTELVKYSPTFQTSSARGGEFISQIQRCAGVVCSKPTTFGWGSPPTTATTKNFGLPGSTIDYVSFLKLANQSGLFGVRDKSFFSNGQHAGRYNFGAGNFSDAELPLQIDSYTHQFDFDGDGIEDFLTTEDVSNLSATGPEERQPGEYLRWRICRGSTTPNKICSEMPGLSVWLTTRNINFPGYFEDFSGDGLPDLLFYWRLPTGGYSLHLAELKRRPLVAAGETLFDFGPPKRIITTSQQPIPSPFCNLVALKDRPRYLNPINLNGDSRVDFSAEIDGQACYLALGSGVFDSAIFRFRAYFTTSLSLDGSTYFLSLKALIPDDNSGPRGKFEEFREADINGDGLTDLLYRYADSTIYKKWWYRLGTQSLTGANSGFEPEVCAIPNQIGGCADLETDITMQLADYDGDGYLDIWTKAVGGANLIVNVWNGKYFQSAVTTQITGAEANGWTSFFTDFDGDSFPEYLAVKKDTTARYSQFAPSQRLPTKILSISDGLGGVTTVEYGQSSDPSLALRSFPTTTEQGRAGSPTVDMESPQWLVSRVSTLSPSMSNATNKRSTRYRYAGQKLQAGRGSLGFRVFETLDEQKLLQTRVEYRQDFPYIGMPLRVTKSLRANAWPAVCVAQTAPAEGCDLSVQSAQPNSPVDFPTLTNSDKLLEDKNYQYANAQTVSNITTPPINIRTIGELTQNYDLNSDCSSANAGNVCNERKLVQSQTTLSDFDAYGNARSEAVSISGWTAGKAVLVQSAIKATTFENRVSPRYLIGLTKTIIEVITRPGQANVLRASEINYDEFGRVVSERKEPRRDVNGALEGNVDLSNMLHMYHQYDSYGNRTKTASCSNHVELIALNDSACIATVANSPGPTVSTIRPDLWVRRFSTASFDSNGRFLTTQYAPFSGSSGMGGVVSRVVARNAWGEATESVDAKGVKTVNYTGAFGRPYATASSLGDLLVVRQKLCGNSVANYCPSGAYRLIHTRNLSGPDAWTYLDVNGREVMNIRESLPVNNLVQYVAVSTAYDNLGRVTRVSNPYFAKAPGLAEVGTATGSAPPFKQTQYDVLDRVVSITHPNQSAETTSFKGFEVKLTRPANLNGQVQTRLEVRNALGEVIRVTDAAGLVVSYRYRATGELENVSRPSDQAGAPSIETKMGFDVHGRKTSMVDPDKGAISYVYNAAGELVTEQNSGTCVKLKYDMLGRMIERNDYTSECTNLSSSAASQYSAAWTYDIVRNGALAGEAMVDRTGLLVSRGYGFDSFHRPNKSTTKIEGVTYESESMFDEYTRPLYSTFKAASDGFARLAEKQEYDASTGIALRTSEAFNDLTYSKINAMDAFGNITSDERAAGVGAATLLSTRMFFADTGLANWIRGGTSAAPTSMINLQYQWDAVQNLSWRNDQSFGRSVYERFSYDNQQRLVSQLLGSNASNANTPVLQLGYAKTGNIISRNGVAYSYGGSSACPSVAGPHAACQVGTTQFGFDARGNQISSSDSRQILYAPFDRAEEIRQGLGITSTVQFAYGPNRERAVRRTFPSVFGVGSAPASEVTHYIGDTEVHRRGTSIEVKRYVGGVLIAQKGPATAATVERRYQWFDHQGSVIAVTDLAGVAVGADGQMSYDAFGLRREAAGGAFNLNRLLGFNTQATTRHGYTGHEMVDESGLIHMHARMYDPRIARFIQADPMIQEPTNSQSLNRYSYVQNNPLNATDPTGMFSVGGFSAMLSAAFAGTDCPACHGTPGHNQGPAFNAFTKLPAQRPQGSLGPAFDNFIMSIPDSYLIRTGGGGQAFLGGYGMYVGGSGLLACSTGVGCILPAAVFLTSADQMQTGVRTGVSGTYAQSGINYGAQFLGASPSTAAKIDLGINLGVGAVSAGTAVAKMIFQSKNGVPLAPLRPIPEDLMTKMEPEAANYGTTIAHSTVSAEALALQQLTAIQAAVPRSHFLDRHGAITTLAQQFVRAVTGFTPDGKIGNPTNSTRFLSNVDQLDALNMANATRQQTGKNVFSFDMNRPIGEGFLRGGATAAQKTSRVQAVYGKNGLVTLFPVL